MKSFLKKNLPYILPAGTALLLLLVLFLPTKTVQAGLIVDFVNNEVISGVFSVIANMVLWTVARLVWIAGAVFDLSINLSLNLTRTVDSIPAVKEGWVVFRDLANVFFIFIMLYLGIKTILGIDADKTKKAVVNLVIVALLINFSLFITRVVIDSSNVVALQFYSAMTPARNDPAFGPLSANFYDGGLSALVMQGLKLTTVYDQSKTEGVMFSGTAGADKSIIVMVLGSVLLLVTAFVFFAGGILFVIRTVVLVLLMILSPLAFIAWLLPKTEQYSKMWWDELFNQSFFAPAYLAIIYVVIKIMNSSTGLVPGAENASLAGALGGRVLSDVALIMNFVILIVLLLSALIIAKKMGAKGGDIAKDLGGKLSFGAAGWAGRQTVGRAARAVADSKGFKNFAGKNPTVGRLTTKGLKGVAGSSFDARSGGPIKGIADALKADIGKGGGKGGFDTMRSERDEGIRSFATSLKPAEKEKEKEKDRLEQAQTKVTKITNDEYKKNIAYADNIKQEAQAAAKRSQAAKASGNTALAESEGARAEQLGKAYVSSVKAAGAKRDESIKKIGEIANAALNSRQNAYAEKVATGLALGGGQASRNRALAEKIREDAKKGGFKEDKDLEKTLKDFIKKEKIFEEEFKGKETEEK